MKVITKKKLDDGTEVFIDDEGQVLLEAELSTAAHYAAIDGNIEIISQLIAAGFDVNKSDGDYTLLAIASFNNYIELATLLLRAGARPNPSRSLVVTPLMLAIFNAHTDMIELLFEYGANVNYLTEKNGNAVREAVGYQRLDIVELLLQPRFNLDRKCPITANALLSAAILCHKQVVKRKIAAGLAVNSDLREDEAILLSVIEDRRVELSKYIIAEGRYPSKGIGGVGSRILKLVISTGQSEILDAIIMRGVMLGETGYNLMLNLAAEHGHIEMVELLLNTMRDYYIWDESLLTAISNNHLNVAYLIIVSRLQNDSTYSIETWLKVIDEKNYFMMRLLMRFADSDILIKEAPHFMSSENGQERARYIADCSKKIIDENDSSEMIMNELRLDHTSRFFGVPLDILKFHLHRMIRHPSLPSINSAISRVDISNVAVEDNESKMTAGEVNESSTADAALEPSMRPRR